MIYEDKWIFEGDSRIEMAVLIILFYSYINKVGPIQYTTNLHLYALCNVIEEIIPAFFKFIIEQKIREQRRPNNGVLQCLISVQILAYKPLLSNACKIIQYNTPVLQASKYNDLY